ncbi:MAG: ATP-binding protein [Nitriliruptoraceae bacterium]
MSPLAARLAIAFVGVALAAVAVLTVLTLLAARGGVSELVERQHQQAAERTAALLGDAHEQADGWEDAELRPALAVASSEGASTTILDADGAPIGIDTTDEMRHMRQRMHGPAGAPGGGPTDPPSEGLADPPLETSHPVEVPIEAEGREVGTLEVRFPTGPQASAAAQLGDALTRNVLTAAGVASLLALLTAGVVATRVTRPLTRLTSTVEAVAAGDRGTRSLTADAPGELGTPGAAVDRMADTLERQDELRRALIADVAHERRTPLAIALGECDALLDGVSEPDPERLASIREEIARLARLVGDLEALAAAESAGLHLDLEALDLGVLVEDLLTLHAPRLRDDGHHLDVEVEGAPVRGDALRLGQIVTNMLTNAAKFSPPDGRITVRVTDGDPVTLEVIDDGPGIPDEELPHVFDRFWQGEAGRRTGGSGVGLAVVAELARAHDGRVHARNVPGRGAAFTLELPRR